MPLQRVINFISPEQSPVKVVHVGERVDSIPKTPKVLLNKGEKVSRTGVKSIYTSNLESTDFSQKNPGRLQNRNKISSKSNIKLALETPRKEQSPVKESSAGEKVNIFRTTE